MKFLRHILSHIMFIILLAGISSVYYFRNQVLPENYVNKIDMYAEKIHPSLVKIASSLKTQQGMSEAEQTIQYVVTPDVVSFVPAAEPELVIEKVEKKDVSVVEIKPVETEKEIVELEQKVVVVSVTEPEVVTIKEAKKADIKAEAVSAPEKSEAIKKVEIAEVKIINKESHAYEVPVAEDKKTFTKTEVTMVVDQPLSTDKQAASYKEILNAARAAFSKSQFKVAIEKYKELIALEGHEADFYGELGNVYYAIGNWDLASEVYYEAALRLIERGDMSQVYYLQRVLNGLDKKRADKLASSLAHLRR